MHNHTFSIQTGIGAICPPTRSHARTHARTHTHTHTHTHAHTRTHAHTHTQVYTHTHTHTHAHTHTHTHTHKYIHTCGCTHEMNPHAHTHTNRLKKNIQIVLPNTISQHGVIRCSTPHVKATLNRCIFPLICICV